MKGDKKLVVGTIFVILTLFFVITIKTIDLYNTRTFLYFSSFLNLSLNPVSFFPLPTPPLTLSIFLPQFYAYNLTTNLQVASDFMRVINIIFSVLSAFLVMKIVSKFTNDEVKSNAAFYVFLLSPFIFFVNYIFNEQDILPIFLTLLSFYLLYFQNSLISSFAGTLLIVYASFFYYFPVLMIPSLLIYENDKKKFLSILLFFLVSFSFFYTSFLKTLNWEILSNAVGAVSPSASGIPVFSILNVIPGTFFSSFTPTLSLVSSAFTVLVLLLVVTIPLLFKHFKKPIFLTLAVVFSLPFLLLKITAVDEFIWILPFLVISFVSFSTPKFIKTKLLIIQLCLLPAFFVFNMYGAPGYGQGSGIFYLTYTQFHVAIAIYSIVPAFELVTRVLDVVGFIAIVLVNAYVLFASKTSTDNKKQKDEPCQNLSTSQSDALSHHNGPIIKIETKNESNTILNFSLVSRLMLFDRQKKIKFVAVFVIFLMMWMFLILPLAGNSEQTITYSGGSFPLGYFASSNYEMNPSLSYNYMPNESFIKLSNYTGNLVVPSVFDRNITNQNLRMNLDIIPVMPSQMVYSDAVAGFGYLNISVVNQFEFNGNYSYLTPWYTENVSSPISANIATLDTGNTSTFSFSGASIEEYNLTSLSKNHTYVMGFKANQVNYNQNLFFASTIGGDSFEFFFSGSSLFFAYLLHNSTYIYKKINTENYSSAWNIMSFNTSNSFIRFSINGLTIYSSKLNLSQNANGYVDIGMAGPYPEWQHKYAFSGNVTSLIETNSSAFTTERVLSISHSGDQRTIPFNSNSISIHRNNSAVQMVSDGHKVIFHGEFHNFWFGRPSQYSPSVEFAFNYFTISTYTEGFLFFKMLIILYVVPLYIGGLIIVDMKKSFSRKYVQT